MTLLYVFQELGVARTMYPAEIAGDAQAIDVNSLDMVHNFPPIIRHICTVIAQVGALFFVQTVSFCFMALHCGGVVILIGTLSADQDVGQVHLIGASLAALAMAFQIVEPVGPVFTPVAHEALFQHLQMEWEMHKLVTHEHCPVIRRDQTALALVLLLHRARNHRVLAILSAHLHRREMQRHFLVFESARKYRWRCSNSCPIYRFWGTQLRKYCEIHSTSLYRSFSNTTVTLRGSVVVRTRG